MAQYQVSFEVEGDQEVVSMFEIAGRKVRNLSTPFQNIARMMLQDIDTNFAGRGSLWGRWKPRKRAYPWPILEQTGVMRGSFRSKVGRDYTEIGNVDPRDIFKYHQSKAPRQTMPRRIMMAIGEKQRREAVRFIQRYIIEGN
jgi:phage gpG-like protein